MTTRPAAGADPTEAVIGTTALVVPVRAAERLSTTAHLTLLDPFLPADRIDDDLLGELHSLFADVTPFAFTLSQVARFPDGRSYLSPDPAGELRRLAQRLRRGFPELEREPDLQSLMPRIDLDVDAEQVRDQLPVEANAVEAALILRTDAGVHTLASFTFGTSAA